MIARFALALAAAVIGGALFGLGFSFFGGFVPNGEARLAFYVLIGIPAWIVAELFGEALYAVIVPSVVRDWHKVFRGAYLVFILSLTILSALFTLTKFPT